MASKEEVKEFLENLEIKMRIWDILFLGSKKNLQTLADLEIRPIDRESIISGLTTDNYYEGPIEETMRGLDDMWVFGKEVKNKEVYIKISLGSENNSSICISFHIAEHSMTYPLKN